ncbi:hypothetical protein EN784_52230 [bacterium M00.F.Ca.ET.141.01.1.1]|nr:hypothetical protein EOA36_32040 [Mesorhizobium sp. M8A.F.Ca.ET.021.01.1.1]TGP87303.1 hypothetical protein EN861_29255 [Mesorhizobium sp. M8A.F.Ca.ET.218.01.1.1]TGS48850.1 hypothetical protein EN825_08125 [Mesorhizobium sp. M8A.F.Ca.ET.182.01.1.1]TGS82858.1 hypothetical protein EN824_00005 [Mesorhizobium sp. M8A.F.Ca.ET.181.01.1.1]TGT15323.1 hypothetical protein EN856_28790 [Mesorhizobium sp. M8A.F.Ca.ET.213.01.1.1]TGT40087.1 hypothetical protein EN808_15845 [Mesorhizobium sp. M8A.F.Ca.ET.1
MLSVHSVTYLSGSDTGTFSPYSDGERGAIPGGFANLRRCKKARLCGRLLSPRLRGEMSGRAMRGSANPGN